MITQEKGTTLWRLVSAVALLLSAVALALLPIAVSMGWLGGVPAEEPVARSVAAGCYRDVGGDKWICQSNGEMEFQSGSTLDIQSGATTGFGAAMDFDSTLNVDGAVTFNSTLDVDGNISSGTGAITVTDNVDITGTLQYGASDLYALGHANSGLQVVYGTSSLTGTATAAHGLTTVTWALCTLGEDPTNGAGDAAMCTVAVSGNVVTVKAWQDDFVTAATETSVDVHWLVIGTP